MDVDSAKQEAVVWHLWVCVEDGDPREELDWVRIREVHVPTLAAAFNLEKRLNTVVNVSEARRYEGVGVMQPPYPAIRAGSVPLADADWATLRSLVLGDGAAGDADGVDVVQRILSAVP